MSTLKVDAIRHNSATSDAITTAADGTCTARITGITGGGGLSHRNLIINGAMQVAQYGTSSTDAGYSTIDRINRQVSGTDESPTFAQVDVASGTTPYTLGFRKCLKITNGNQTSGAGSSDYLYFWYILEAQDVANSGWNYTSASSYITISYWVKSSVAQNFYGMMQTADGTGQNYVWETGSLSADTWTKITKTIPGNSNLQFDNDANAGLYVAPIRAFDGTDRTASMSLNTWAAYSGSSRTPDATSTWYTTNDATLEVTGLQLEVGSVATDFEHRSYGDELARCQRYCVVIGGDDEVHLGTGNMYNSTNVMVSVHLPVAMRSKPTPSVVTSGGNWVQVYMGANGNISNASVTVGDSGGTCKDIIAFRLYLQNAHSGLTAGQALWCHTIANAKLILSAEL